MCHADEFKATNCRVRFGRSLWSAIGCHRKWLTFPQFSFDRETATDTFSPTSARQLLPQVMQINLCCDRRDLERDQRIIYGPVGNSTRLREPFESVKKKKKIGRTSRKTIDTIRGKRLQVSWVLFFVLGKCQLDTGHG